MLGSMQRVEVSTKSRPIRDWRKDSTIGRYFEIGQVCGKIPSTMFLCALEFCNQVLLFSSSVLKNLAFNNKVQVAGS